jgi:prepilin peptidase CpaA
MLREFVATAALWGGYGAIVAGMVWDLVAYRIPNFLSLAVACLFPVASLAAGGDVDWTAHLGTGAAQLVVGAVLFRLRWFGGGDVKLLAAIGLWIGLKELPLYLAYVGLIGGGLGLGLILIRRLVGCFGSRQAGSGGRLPRLLERDGPVPYGLAIGAGALLVGLS